MLIAVTRERFYKARERAGFDELQVDLKRLGVCAQKTLERVRCPRPSQQVSPSKRQCSLTTSQYIS
eukprot:m.319738 g.319738  ORF g.319738 m.319738 type:complete len:66 (+) comp16448_c0_seq8:7255-7452(+)